MLCAPLLRPNRGRRRLGLPSKGRLGSCLELLEQLWRPQLEYQVAGHLPQTLIIYYIEVGPFPSHHDDRHSSPHLPLIL